MRLARHAVCLALASLAMPTKAFAGDIYVLSPCAPISLLTGFIPEDPFAPSSPIFIDGKPAGRLRVCDALRIRVGEGKHNLRVKLAGKSDTGIASDEGMAISVGASTKYVAMTGNHFGWANEVDTDTGRQMLSNARTARGK